MADASSITEHMGVIGADGEHVGTVDYLEGERIVLTKSDSADDRHHAIGMDMVDHVDSHVHLNVPAAEALEAA
jgi:hypothetical protein